MNTMQVTSTGIAVALAVAIALGLLFFGPQIFGPFSPVTDDETAIMTDLTTSTTTMTTSAPIPSPLPTELTITDDIVGTGAVATSGKLVTVTYVGMLADGTVFDASSLHPETQTGFSFPLGAGGVIKGWDEGVVGMKEGGKRRLIIPADLAYGSRDYGPIPANSTLIFDIELLKVQ